MPDLMSQTSWLLAPPETTSLSGCRSSRCLAFPQTIVLPSGNSHRLPLGFLAAKLPTRTRFPLVISCSSMNSCSILSPQLPPGRTKLATENLWFPRQMIA